MYLLMNPVGAGIGMRRGMGVRTHSWPPDCRELLQSLCCRLLLEEGFCNRASETTLSRLRMW